MRALLCRAGIAMLFATLLVACGGGGGSAPAASGDPTPTLTSIALSPLAVSLAPGASQALTVTGTFSDGTTKVLAATGEKFASSAPDAVTVDASGVVAVSANAVDGTKSSISVTDVASGLSASSAGSTVVTVVAPTLVSIAVSPAAFALAPGAQQQLTVTGTYSNGTNRVLAAVGEQFVSSNPSVVTVDGNGVVTVTPGAMVGASASISVSDKASGISTPSGHPAAITVSAATLVSIALSPGNFTLPLGATQQLSVVGSYSDGSVATLSASGERFASSSSAIATVSSSGLVTVPTAATVGDSTSINATDLASGLSTTGARSAVVTVSAAALRSVILSPALLALPPGTTGQLTVTGTFSDGSTRPLAASGEAFSSSNLAVASVDGSGLVAAPAAAAVGATSSISATDVASGIATATSGQTTVTVSPAVLVSIALSPSAFTLAPGAPPVQLSVTGTYSDGSTRPVATSGESFSSSNSAIATVTGAGLVAVTAGAAAGVTATVSATDVASGISTTNGQSATVTVAPTLVSIALAPATFALAPGGLETLSVAGLYSDGSTRALPASAESFTSSNPAAAIVNAAGIVSAVAGAAVGATGVISATDAASGVSTASGGSAQFSIVAASGGPTLRSIALSPSTYASSPVGAPQTLTVTGTYSDGSTQVLPNSGEIFSSSNEAVAYVNAAGIVAIASGAPVGGTATVGVTDAASGISALPASTTLVTATLPSPTSVAAATATAVDNPLCVAIGPFYWEIGDQSGALASASVGTTSSGPITASTSFSIASASKLLYAAYVTQIRGAAANLSPTSDVPFLNLTSGYMNMNDSTTQSVCPPTLSPDTVAACLQLTDPKTGLPNSYQNPAYIGSFYYNSGHMENHAGANPAIASLVVQSLGGAISAQLGSGVAFAYTEPLLSGGVTTSASTYAAVLRNILSGSLAIREALGTHPVCTLHSSTCNASFTPFPLEAWDYSIGHWVEDNPATNGDGAFSSGGSDGFYPWIDSTKSYYGISSQDVATGTGGYPAIQCGRLIRRAFITGIEQTGTLPTP